MGDIEKALRVALARVFEHYPRCSMLTGIFSAPQGKKLDYEFAVAGEEKVRLRMQTPSADFRQAVVLALATEFEKHHGVKPAFVMEWLLSDTVIQQGVGAIADEIARQIVEEARSHKTTPDDWMDMDCYFRTLKVDEDDA